MDETDTEKKICATCGRVIIPGLEMWMLKDGKLEPCHRDCGRPAVIARILRRKGGDEDILLEFF